MKLSWGGGENGIERKGKGKAGVPYCYILFGVYCLCFIFVILCGLKGGGYGIHKIKWYV